MSHAIARAESARVIAQGASCADCTKTWAGPTSRTQAKAHVRAVGHTIHAEVTRIERWQPKSTGENR